MAISEADLKGHQPEAYTCRAPRVLITGGPGSGKTLVALFMARRIVEEDPDGRRVLFLTFSRAATSELSGRVPGIFAGRLGERVEVTTFHGFAVGALDAFRRYVGGPDEPLSIATREEADLGVATTGSVGFDDLVPAALRLFRDAPWILDLQRDRLAAVVCDEFQDTRDEYLALLDVLASGRQLICLADPDQMIFDGLPGGASIVRRIEAYRGTGPTEIDLGPTSHRDPTQIIPPAAAAIRDGQLTAPQLQAAIDAGRVTIDTVRSNVRDHAVDAIKSALAGGASSVGVFFSTNRQVNEFADRLRFEGLDHEIGGLSHASGEAELATATLARFVVGQASWDDVLRRLGVFLASTTRGTPPPIAHQLVAGDTALDPGLAGLLRAERDAMSALNHAAIGDFLAVARGMWPRVFAGGVRLWELGLNDLTSSALGLRAHPLNDSTSADLLAIAAQRRTSSAIDSLPGVEASIRLMNLYQIKGRQMDVTLTVREPGDREPLTLDESSRLGRLIFVAMTRARTQARIVIPWGARGYFGPIATLAR